MTTVVVYCELQTLCECSIAARAMALPKETRSRSSQFFKNLLSIEKFMLSNQNVYIKFSKVLHRKKKKKSNEYRLPEVSTSRWAHIAMWKDPGSSPRFPAAGGEVSWALKQCCSLSLPFPAPTPIALCPIKWGGKKTAEWYPPDLKLLEKK